MDLLAVQGTLKSLLQHHSSKASILWCSAFFTVQLSHPYTTTGKTRFKEYYEELYAPEFDNLDNLPKLCCLVAQLYLTLCDPIDWEPARLLCPGDFPGKNTGVGCHALLQGIFPTQGLSPCLSHLQVLYHKHHLGSSWNIIQCPK